MTTSRSPRRFATRRTAVTDWKTDRDALVDEGMAFAKVVPGEAPAKDFVERPRLEPMNWGGPQREEIRQRVSNFKAYQQRLTKEREEYATATLKKMNRSPI
jgi:hypothetical protein